MCIIAGKSITTAVAVVEDGHATFTVGELTGAELLAHASKFDQVLGVYTRDYERLRTEMYMEQLHATGIEIPVGIERFYEDELNLKFRKRTEVVELTLIRYLKTLRGFSIEKASRPLHVRHLERMRHRTGYIMKQEDFEDAITRTPRRS